MRLLYSQCFLTLVGLATAAGLPIMEFDLQVHVPDTATNKTLDGFFVRPEGTDDDATQMRSFLGPCKPEWTFKQVGDDFTYNVGGDGQQSTKWSVTLQGVYRAFSDALIMDSDEQTTPGFSWNRKNQLTYNGQNLWFACQSEGDNNRDIIVFLQHLPPTPCQQVYVERVWSTDN